MTDNKISVLDVVEVNKLMDELDEAGRADLVKTLKNMMSELYRLKMKAWRLHDLLDEIGDIADHGEADD